MLGLGNIGPGAALPVMEGKAALFKRFADIDAWPICLDTQDTDEIVRAVELIAPGFGGINLEDIAAPRCFEIERRLRESLDIPVFHDDQHGTAIVVLAALTNALRVRGQEARPTSASSSPAAAPPASAIVHAAARRRAPATSWSATARASSSADDDAAQPGAWPSSPRAPTRAGVRGDLHDALRGRRRVHRRQRAGHPAGRVDRRHGRPSRSSSRWPTPTPRSTRPRPRSTPRSWPAAARDYPNQINNVLAFPGVFRGLLDARATRDHHRDAAQGGRRDRRTSSRTTSSTPNFIIPSVFDPDVPKAVAAAIRGADA